MENSNFQNLKIKLNNHVQFVKAWDSLVVLGYQYKLKPHTCPYLYTDTNGRITYDFFDPEGTDLSNPNTALGYFKNHKNNEITLDELNALAERHAVWSKAPLEAFHWERLPSGKCIWHCRAEDGRSFDKKAPNFKIERKTMWRDLEKQKQADASSEKLNSKLAELNITLV